MAEDVPVGVGEGVAVGDGVNVGVNVIVGVGTQFLLWPLHGFAETFEELINNKITIAIMAIAVIEKMFLNRFRLVFCCIGIL